MAQGPDEERIADVVQDDGVGDVLRLVREACPATAERYERRGELLCSHMRAVKAARRSTGSQQVASHVQERIEKMNADYAVRAEDHIDVTETRPQRMVGPGSWKHWLPSAILRCCWGLGLRPRSRCKTRTPCTTKRLAASADKAVTARRLCAVHCKLL